MHEWYHGFMRDVYGYNRHANHTSEKQNFKTYSNPSDLIEQKGGWSAFPDKWKQYLYKLIQIFYDKTEFEVCYKLKGNSQPHNITIVVPQQFVMSAAEVTLERSNLMSIEAQHAHPIMRHCVLGDVPHQASQASSQVNSSSQPQVQLPLPPQPSVQSQPQPQRVSRHRQHIARAHHQSQLQSQHPQLQRDQPAQPPQSASPAHSQVAEVQPIRDINDALDVAQRYHQSIRNGMNFFTILCNRYNDGLHLKPKPN